jgi:regulator of sigma D
MKEHHAVKHIITTAVILGTVALGATACGDLESGDHPFTAKAQNHKAKDGAKAKAAVDNLTTGQEQAVGSAQDYLSTGHFSEQGLIGQLSSKYGDGFAKKDAIFAVHHIKVDWNKQAVGSAKDYLSTGHFSRDGLIGQLSSAYGDQFTKAQAIYAVNHVGL